MGRGEQTTHIFPFLILCGYEKCYDNVSFDPGASSPFSTLQPGWGFKTDAIKSIPSLKLFIDSPLSSGQSPDSLSLLKIKYFIIWN